ncbi:MAG: hypothetical protein ACE5HI_06145 [bacterium]
MTQRALGDQARTESRSERRDYRLFGETNWIEALRVGIALEFVFQSQG